MTVGMMLRGRGPALRVRSRRGCRSRSRRRREPVEQLSADAARREIVGRERHAVVLVAVVGVDQVDLYPVSQLAGVDPAHFNGPRRVAHFQNRSVEVDEQLIRGRHARIDHESSNRMLRQTCMRRSNYNAGRAAEVRSDLAPRKMYSSEAISYEIFTLPCNFGIIILSGRRR
jgi:hypothetical protein